jgi:hypothetical protein
VPVLAIYQAQLPFEEVAKQFDIRSEDERAARDVQEQPAREADGGVLPPNGLGLTRVAPDGRWCNHERPLVNANR